MTVIKIRIPYLGLSENEGNGLVYVERIKQEEEQIIAVQTIEMLLMAGVLIECERKQES